MIRAAVISSVISLLPLGAKADPCFDRQHLEAFLKSEYGMKLYSWGLTDAGDMAELWWSDSGHFATVLTAPSGCVSVVMPRQLHDRLRQPPQRNRAVTPGPIDRGEPT